MGESKPGKFGNQLCTRHRDQMATFGLAITSKQLEIKSPRPPIIFKSKYVQKKKRGRRRKEEKSTHKDTQRHTQWRACACARALTHIHTYMLIHTQTNTHTLKYTHTRTHIYTLWSLTLELPLGGYTHSFTLSLPTSTPSIVVSPLPSKLCQLWLRHERGTTQSSAHLSTETAPACDLSRLSYFIYLCP